MVDTGLSRNGVDLAPQSEAPCGILHNYEYSPPGPDGQTVRVHIRTPSDVSFALAA